MLLIEITRGPGERLSLLWGDVDIAVMLLLLEVESRIHGLGGRPFFARFKGVLKLKKDTPKEPRSACPQFVIHVQ